MTRRRYPRFALSEPQWGTLEVLEYVDIESGEDGELVITARAPVAAGEEVTLHLADATETESVRVRVVDSRLHVVNGEVRHRIRLVRLDQTPGATPAESAE